MLLGACTLLLGLSMLCSARSCTPAQSKIWLCFRSRTAVAPIERLKILMQVQGNEKVYTNLWQVCSQVLLPSGRPVPAVAFSTTANRAVRDALSAKFRTKLYCFDLMWSITFFMKPSFDLSRLYTQVHVHSLKPCSL